MFYIIYHIIFFLTIGTTLICLMRNSNKWKSISKHDALTGLLNRKEFDRLLTKKIEFVKQNPEFMLIYCMINLDNFREINSLSGRNGGDRILKRVAKNLKSKIQSFKNDNYLLEGNKKYPKICYENIICRYSGDEFAVVIIAQRHFVDRRITYELEEACTKSGCGASVGSAIFLPDMNIHIEDLIENADFIMQNDKMRRKKKSMISKEELIELCPDYEEYIIDNDRRKHKRIKVKNVICTFKFSNLSCFRDETSFKGKLLNISQNGLAFLSSVSNVGLMRIKRKIQIEYVLKNKKYFHEAEIRYFNSSTNVCGCKFV